MKNHTSLINYIAAKIGAKSYLEIGTNNCKNFNEIQVAHKVGVDPDLTSPCSVHKTSDDFFRDNQEIFDLVFIDGLHHADQVKRDIINTWGFLSAKGVMVIHDVNPSEEKYTHVPRDSKVWNGDVWKIAASLVAPKFTIDMDHGCMVVPKIEANVMFDLKQIDWETFDKNRKELLTIVSINEALEIIDAWT